MVRRHQNSRSILPHEDLGDPQDVIGLRVELQVGCVNLQPRSC